MTNTDETIPQRARRKGKDYADTYHDRWSHEGRRWIKFAFARGYQAACEDIADDIDRLDIDINALDEILDRYDTREEVAA